MNVRPINRKLFQNGNHFNAYLSQNFDVIEIHAMHSPNKILKAEHNENVSNIPRTLTATIVIPMIRLNMLHVMPKSQPPFFLPIVQTSL